MKHLLFCVCLFWIFGFSVAQEKEKGFTWAYGISLNLGADDEGGCLDDVTECGPGGLLMPVSVELRCGYRFSPKLTTTAGIVTAYPQAFVQMDYTPRAHAVSPLFQLRTGVHHGGLPSLGAGMGVQFAKKHRYLVLQGDRASAEVFAVKITLGRRF